jgi:RNA polymerase sigma-70 factor (ECF subfamily)
VGESAADDLALVRRTLGGGREAFDALVRRHQRSVYAVVRGILRSDPDAEDATQDVFLRAFRYLPSYDPSRSFEGWLMAIAVNQARSARRTRRSEAPLDPAALPAVERPSNPEIRDAAARAIDALPERQRDAMLLFLNTELTLDQIADALGCSKGAVGAHLHRARATLKKALGRWVS